MRPTASTCGVDYQRGVIHEPAPHPDTCEDRDGLRSLVAAADGPVVADLFCGAGGLSLGLREAGFEVLVGVDTDSYALQTHASQFPGLHLDWDLTLDDRVEELADILNAVEVTLIAGGPPCQPFSKAGRSMIRDLVRRGHRPREDGRRDLWQSFLAVVERVRPPAVMMENVPEMALDRDMLILRTMVDELERLDYGVEAEVVETATYGVPQYRERLILVAVSDGREFEWPHDRWDRTDGAPVAVNLRDAIGDLPDVQPGWRSDGAGGLVYGGPRTEFQQRMRRDVPADQSEVVYDQVTRSVRPDDLEAFKLLDSETRYSELPDRLKRYRDDIFDDKYKRLDYEELCRTITAHIAKDGYWYIHPEYHRTLTVREAARVQTFPDEMRFAGPPTAALRQIGNAVPPALGEHLGPAVLRALGDGSRNWTTRRVSSRLSDWWRSRTELNTPWLRPITQEEESPGTPEQGRWLVVQAEILLRRATTDLIRVVWPRIAQLRTPSATLANREFLEWVLGDAHGVGRGDRLHTVLDLAENFAHERTLLADRSGLREAGVPPAATDTAMRVYPGEEDPVIGPTGVLRVAARFHGSETHTRNRKTDGRIRIARLVGVDPASADDEDEPPIGSEAHLALLELSSSLCRSDATHCSSCPLSEWCSSASPASGVGVAGER